MEKIQYYMSQRFYYDANYDKQKYEDFGIVWVQDVGDNALVHDENGEKYALWSKDNNKLLTPWLDSAEECLK